VAERNKFEEIDEKQSSTSATLSSLSRTRDKSEKLLWKWNADTLPRCPRDNCRQDQAGPGTSLRSCCESRMLNNGPADPEIIATRTTRAKSQRTAVTVFKNTHAESKKINVRTENKPREPRRSKLTLLLTASKAPSTTTEPERQLC
jgi:hypothetical protein